MWGAGVAAQTHLYSYCCSNATGSPGAEGADATVTVLPLKTTASSYPASSTAAARHAANVGWTRDANHARPRHTMRTARGTTAARPSKELLEGDRPAHPDADQCRIPHAVAKKAGIKRTTPTPRRRGRTRVLVSMPQERWRATADITAALNTKAAQVSAAGCVVVLSRESSPDSRDGDQRTKKRTAAINKASTPKGTPSLIREPTKAS